MSKHDDGGPASEKSLLDEFAGQAMIGLFAQSAHPSSPGINQESYGHAAAEAYRLAAAMIAEKRRREGGAE